MHEGGTVIKQISFMKCQMVVGIISLEKNRKAHCLSILRYVPNKYFIYINASISGFIAEDKKKLASNSLVKWVFIILEDCTYTATSH